MDDAERRARRLASIALWLGVAGGPVTCLGWACGVFAYGELGSVQAVGPRGAALGAVAVAAVSYVVPMAAIVLGHVALARAQKGPLVRGERPARGRAVTALVLGYGLGVGTLLLALVLIALFFALGAGLAGQVA